MRLAVAATAACFVLAVQACDHDTSRRYYPSSNACAAAHPHGICIQVQCIDVCDHALEWYLSPSPPAVITR
jgi:hypothetical protein